MRNKRDEPRVFFPWEKRRGLRALFVRGRARLVLVAVVGVAVFVWLRQRESRAAETRATRATITTTTDAMAAWRADHDRSCPESLSSLVSGGYLRRVPRDAWGRPLRVRCPGRIDAQGFDVSSDGPDGEPGGLDQVQ
jgi:general secretion pathway protein G